jgi:hypothetical protein
VAVSGATVEAGLPRVAPDAGDEGRRQRSGLPGFTRWLVTKMLVEEIDGSV